MACPEDRGPRKAGHPAQRISRHRRRSPRAGRDRGRRRERSRGAAAVCQTAPRRGGIRLRCRTLGAGRLSADAGATIRPGHNTWKSSYCDAPPPAPAGGVLPSLRRRQDALDKAQPPSRRFRHGPVARYASPQPLQAAASRRKALARRPRPRRAARGAGRASACRRSSCACASTSSGAGSTCVACRASTP